MKDTLEDEMRQKTLWQYSQQVAATIEHLEAHSEGLRRLDPPAPPGVVEDIESAVHHLKNAIVGFEKERDRRKKLTEEYHKKLRQPEE